MATIRLNDILTTYNDVAAAGNRFYSDIVQNKTNADKITIDMTDVTSLPSIFLNVSFGKIIDDMGVDVVRTMFTFSNITKAQAERLQKYFAAYKHS